MRPPPRIKAEAACFIASKSNKIIDFMNFYYILITLPILGKSLYLYQERSALI
jgi:hypothetical protein